MVVVAVVVVLVLVVLVVLVLKPMPLSSRFPFPCPPLWDASARRGLDIVVEEAVEGGGFRCGCGWVDVGPEISERESLSSGGGGCIWAWVWAWVWEEVVEVGTGCTELREGEPLVALLGGRREGGISRDGGWRVGAEGLNG